MPAGSSSSESNPKPNGPQTGPKQDQTMTRNLQRFFEALALWMIIIKDPAWRLTLDILDRHIDDPRRYSQVLNVLATEYFRGWVPQQRLLDALR